jgi:hypothetical protein
MHRRKRKRGQVNPSIDPCPTRRPFTRPHMSVAQDGTFLPRPGLSGTTHKGDVRVDGGLGEFFFSWNIAAVLLFSGRVSGRELLGGLFTGVSYYSIQNPPVDCGLLR